MALAVDVGLASVAAGLCAALGRWSAAAVGEAWVWTGLAAAGYGGLAVYGAWTGRAATLGYAASAGVPEPERRLHAARDTFVAYRRMILAFLVALPLVAAGIWLDPRAP